MKRFWFKFSLGLLTVSVSGVAMFLVPKQVDAYQDASTPTGTGAFITVIYTEDINVRSGPSTVLYPDRIGQLKPAILPRLLVFLQDMSGFRSPSHLRRMVLDGSMQNT